jgi:hypothetical protein
MRLLSAILAATLWLGLNGTASAQNLQPAAFYGHYVGGGIAESADSLYFGVTVRDMDVVVEPSDEGFFVAWTTVIRQGGDPSNPDVRRKSTEYEFVPTSQPDVHRGKTSSDPLDGGVYAWARFEGNTLNVYLLSIDEAGIYSMQSYARTLTGGGMELVFKRIRNGEATRVVKAKLVKVAD